jgi:hypothetical protein
VSRPRLLPRLLPVAAALTVALMLAGCGKKPKIVDPPQGKENDHFPRTYPAPAGAETPAKRPAPPTGVQPNLGAPNAGTSPDDESSPLPTVGGLRFP